MEAASESDCAEPSRANRRSPAVLIAVAVALTIAFYAWRFWLLHTVEFDRDEFEHLHAAWNLSRGLIPYQDFWEHHTPWLWFMLAPLYRFYPVDSDPDAALRFIFLARSMMAVFAALGLILTFVLARLWKRDRVAWIATAALSMFVAFMQKTLEVRPDVPAMVLWLGCLVSLVQGFGAAASRRQAFLFALSGFLLGGATMFTQKQIVILPFFAAGMLWYLFAAAGNYMRRFANCVWQLGGFSVPILATLAFFAAHGALGSFAYYNLILNLGWKSGLPFPGMIPWAFRQNPIMISLGILGIVVELFRAFHGVAFSRDRFLLLVTIGAIAGLAVLPEAWLQYYLTFLPLLAIYAANILDTVIGQALRDTDFLKPVTGATLLLVLAALSIRASLRMSHLATNSEQIHKLTWVLAHSKPNASVLDCWSGLGVFRPNAYFYSMLYSQLLDPNARAQLVAELYSTRAAPKLVFPSADLLRWLSPEAPAALLANYRPIPGEFPIFVLRASAWRVQRANRRRSYLLWLRRARRLGWPLDNYRLMREGGSDTMVIRGLPPNH
jgi:hypothetical protein